MPPLVTVYTPTWNRAHTLPRVWESLQKQTYRDFEWIVSDDGSTDDTLALLERWQREAAFPMRIRAFPRHVGKPALDNDAARAARGEYLIIADSDDAFVPHAVERFAQVWESIPDERRDEYCLVNAQSVCHDGTPVGPPFPSSPFDTTSLELSAVHGLHYDSWTCYRTAVARAHPYPEIDHYVPESIVWVHTIGRRYKIRCVNDTLRIMYRNNNDHGITGTGKMRYNRGYAYGRAVSLNNPDLAVLGRRPALRDYFNYARLSHHGGVRPSEAIGLLASPAHRAVVVAAYPLAWLVAARDRAQGKVEQPPYAKFEGAPMELGPVAEAAR